MIPRAFLPAISLAVLLLHGGEAICPDDYPPASFEAAGDALTEFLDEYFTDRNLSFPPDPADRRLHLKKIAPTAWELPESKRRSGRRSYPLHPGIWRIDRPGEGLSTVHLLLKEPAALAEQQAFNTYNELLGDAFADYDNRAYVMILQPEEVRRSWRGRYLGLGVRIYGVADDATGLTTTYADILLTDYTPWVRRYRRCKESHETAAAGR